MSAILRGELAELLPLFFYLALFAIVYIETALIFAFFIPGDTLLFSAGLVVAASSSLNIWAAMLLVSLAAYLGDQSAYFLGKRYGISYISRRDSNLLNTLLAKAEDFYSRHGVSTIFLSRFYPWFRTLIPFLAGVGQMPRRKFLLVNFFSASLWGSGITAMGYLANSIPTLHENSRLIAAFFILLTIGLAFKNYLKNRALIKARVSY